MSEIQAYRTMIEYAHTDLRTVISLMDDEAFTRRPTPDANPVNFIYFHVLRHWDRDINIRILAMDPEEDAWHRGGFSERTGYHPLGKGTSGIGTGYGYTAGEVDEVTGDRGALMAYQEMLMAETTVLLDSLDEASLTTPRPSPSGSVLTTAGRLQHLIAHTYVHVGDIEYAKGLLGSQPADVPNIS